MTVAVVHDFLTQRGGAERVVLHIARQLRDPVIVTAMYAPEETYPEFKEFPIITDRRVSGRAARHFRYRALSYAGVFRQMDIDFAEVAIISSSTFAHHVRHKNTLVYWYTPPRFLYDPTAYFGRPSVAKGFGIVTSGMRARDQMAARGHGTNYAVSAVAAGRLQESYGLDAEVLYPPFEMDKFCTPPSLSISTGPPRALMVARLLPYKRVDLAISACRAVGIGLTVIGQGPDEERLHSLADASVTFIPHVTDAELIDAYDAHTFVLVPGIEDFGYIPVEAASRGRPTIASNHGGARETVIDGLTGVLVDDHETPAWATAIRRTLSATWNPNLLRESVSRFDSRNFDDGLVRGLPARTDPYRIFLNPPESRSMSRSDESLADAGELWRGRNAKFRQGAFTPGDSRERSASIA